VNELVIPNYKQTWGSIRKIADLNVRCRTPSGASEEYSA
jgi:arsenite oxidase large subunit